MLIGVCGGLCAGKREVAQYLITEHSFTPLQLQLQHQSRTVTPNDKGDSKLIVFTNPTELIDYVTPRWREHFVVTVNNERELEHLLGRPFFILLSIDAPVFVRWTRWKKRCEAQKQPSESLEEFILDSDKHLFDPHTGIARVADRATIKLLNSTDNLSALHQKLSCLNLTDPERLRPSWDAYFMQLASLAALRSNCMKRRVGAVLVREKRVMATGYNGAPRGLKNCNEGGCGRCNSGIRGGLGLSTCLCMHAEENALLEAGRERVGAGAIIYCNTCPCLTCSIKIVQVGISEVVYNEGYSMDEQTAAVLSEGGVKLRQYQPPRDGLVSLEE